MPISFRACARSADQTSTHQAISDQQYQYSGPQDRFDQVQEWLIQHNIHGTDRFEQTFPTKCARFHTLPHVFYWKGNLDLFSEPILAVVGPRKPSVYLHDVMDVCIQQMKGYRFVTMSGGAEGIDMLLHEGSLRMHIPTIIILGAGFRRFVTNSKTDLVERVIEQGGCVVSERKIDQQPARYTFPQRNRAIAGYADAVFTPGASHGSGSLITIDFANKFGIPTGTVPGPIFDITCAGTNQYIAEKRIHAYSVPDRFYADYFASSQARENTNTTNYSAEELAVIDLLTDSPKTLLEIVQKTQMPIDTALGILTHLEMKQVVSSPSPGVYSIHG